MKNGKLQMAFIGCGGIAFNKHFPSLAELPELCEMVAFCDIVKERAVNAAKEYGTEDAKVYTDYNEMLKDDAIDVVHVLTPNVAHCPATVAAFEAGKHVLCEKPMVLKRVRAEELFQTAKDRGLILFEGIKTAYCPGFQKLLGIACSGSIGSIRNVEACFTKLESPDSRELTDRRWGGSFTELGSYGMLPVLKLFGKDFEDIRFDSIQGENGLDLFTRVSLKYPAGVAAVTCGLGVKSEGRLLIAGTKGYIVAEAPWWKTSYFEVHHEDPGNVQKYSEIFLGDGLRYEISDFLSLINGRERNCFKLTRGDSVALAEVMERFLCQSGRE